MASSLSSSGRVVPPSVLEYVARHMTSFDCGAHDIAHVHRVANLAAKIAIAEECKGASVDVFLVYVAGLVHDVLDSKLLLDSSKTKSTEEELCDMLATDNFLTAEEIAKVLVIVKSVGYKNLLKPDFHPEALSLEYRCVQDADLLDAIGMVGVARCFAFGGKRSRTMFGVTQENTLPSSEKYAIASKQIGQGGATGIDHFFEKLLRIKDIMTTSTGTDLAKVRHQNMMMYLRQLDEELEDATLPSSPSSSSASSSPQQSVFGRMLNQVDSKL
jgi:uncharacterized protein